MSTTMPSLASKAAPVAREQDGQEPQPRLGLALSGGGFRAAFFHIGVLARLAELDMLRHVQVISTVSGGSIIGALYYIYLKNLLEQHADIDVNRDHYLRLIDEMEKSFTLAVQTNIRMRVFDSLPANLHMASARYSRTDRIGELLDEHLYRPAYGVGRRCPVMMDDLKINPAPCDASGKHKFDPPSECRNNLVPQLLLNATELNTGHTWRFEAIQMGEPDRDRRLPEDQHLIFREIDTGLRLRRIKYECHRDKVVRVGRAAAASAAVPTIFPPFPISELYPNVINPEAGSRYLRVQLTDGGVHDNQGINALRHRECTHFIVSDASGQLEDEAEPETGAGAVLRRSMDILMDRVREEQLFWLKPSLLSIHAS